MDPSSIDRLSRALARAGTRRRILGRIGAGGAATAAVAAHRVASPVSALAAGGECEATFVGHVRLGPTHELAATPPLARGEVRGLLSFSIGTGGEVASATLTFDDGETLAGLGQLDGHSLALRLVGAPDRLVYLDGIAVAMVKDCSGRIDGLMRGPSEGDLGDWHAILGENGDGGSGAACPVAGQISCDGDCIDPMSSNQNCGACGEICSAPGNCHEGVCHCEFGYGTCLPGYVWREAFSGDYVCVEPWSRDQAAADNAAAGERVDPNCVYGSDACQSGYVWREAFAGDHVCVDGSVRSQAAADNAAAARRIDPSGAYGPNSCVAGYVWREAGPSDLVCVTPGVRTQAANDNAAAAGRVDPNCVFGADACLSGYVWREAAAGDAVCVESWVRDQTAYENAMAGDTVDPLCLT